MPWGEITRRLEALGLTDDETVEPIDWPGEAFQLRKNCAGVCVVWENLARDEVQAAP